MRPHRAPPCHTTRRLVLRLSLVLVIALALSTLASPSQAAVVSPKKYARMLASAHYGWTGVQHRALDAIVRPESGWNPCRRYPSTTDCGYAGSNACGIPQASPCPHAWRGRLASSWREQVRWLLAYIENRYHDPVTALAFRRTHNWY